MCSAPEIFTVNSYVMIGMLSSHLMQSEIIIYGLLESVRSSQLSLGQYLY